MLATNIESEVEEILKKKGKGGWLRVAKCAKIYGLDPSTGKENASRETKFYRWRKQVEKGKVEGFRILKLSGNISFIGLESADPSVIKTFMDEDKGILRSAKSGFGFLEYLKWRKLNTERKRKEEISELEAEFNALCEIADLNEDEYTNEKAYQIREKWRKKFGLKK